MGLRCESFALCQVWMEANPAAIIPGVDSPFFSIILLLKRICHCPWVSGGLLERRIPGKNGEGTPRNHTRLFQPHSEIQPVDFFGCFLGSPGFLPLGLSFCKGIHQTTCGFPVGFLLKAPQRGQPLTRHTFNRRSVFLKKKTVSMVRETQKKPTHQPHVSSFPPLRRTDLIILDHDQSHPN